MQDKSREKRRGERNKDYKQRIYQQLRMQDGRNETGVRGQEKINSDSDLMFQIINSVSRDGMEKSSGQIKKRLVEDRVKEEYVTPRSDLFNRIRKIC